MNEKQEPDPCIYCDDAAFRQMAAEQDARKMRIERDEARKELDVIRGALCVPQDANLGCEAATLMQTFLAVEKQRDQARADGRLVLEHLERQQGYEQLLRQVIASLIDAIPGEGPCAGLPCDGLTAPCAICCAQAVLG